jgi:hypothetical protein
MNDDGRKTRYGPLYALLAYRACCVVAAAWVCVSGTWWHSFPLLFFGFLGGGTFQEDEE